MGADNANVENKNNKVLAGLVAIKAQIIGTIIK